MRLVVNGATHDSPHFEFITFTLGAYLDVKIFSCHETAYCVFYEIPEKTPLTYIMYTHNNMNIGKAYRRAQLCFIGKLQYIYRY